MTPTNVPDPAIRAAVEKRASDTLRSVIAYAQQLEAEVATLREKVASFEHRDRVVGIVESMEEKGLLPGMTRSEKIAHVANVDDIDVLTRAVALAGGNGSKIAELARVPDRGASGEDAFLHFCLTGESP